MAATKKSKKPTTAKRSVNKTVKKPTTVKKTPSKPRAKKIVAKELTFTQHITRFGRKKFLALTVLIGLLIVTVLIAASSLPGIVAGDGIGSSVLGITTVGTPRDFRVMDIHGNEARFIFRTNSKLKGADGFYLYCDKCSNGNAAKYDISKSEVHIDKISRFNITITADFSKNIYTLPSTGELKFRLSAYKQTKNRIRESRQSNSSSYSASSAIITTSTGFSRLIEALTGAADHINPAPPVDKPAHTNPGTIRSAKWVNMTRVAANVRDGQVKFYSTHAQDRFNFWCEDKNGKQIAGSSINIPNTLQSKDKNGDRYRLSNNRYVTSIANRFCYIAGVKKDSGGVNRWTPTVEVTY